MDVYEASLELISIYRHEFLNHLQVIGGLAQLGKTERLMEFVRKSGEEIQQLGRLSACGDPRLALMIYNYFWLDPDIGLSLQVRDRLKQLTAENIEALAHWIDFCHVQLKALGPCEITVSIKDEDSPCLSLQANNLPAGATWCPVTDSAPGSGCYVLTEPGENRLTLFLDKLRPPEER